MERRLGVNATGKWLLKGFTTNSILWNVFPTEHTQGVIIHMYAPKHTGRAMAADSISLTTYEQV